MRRVMFNGALHRAEPVNFAIESQAEPWVTYKLEDGTFIKIRFSITEFLRVKGQYTPTGEPIYNFNHVLSMSVSSPENLMQPEVVPAEDLVPQDSKKIN